MMSFVPESGVAPCLPWVCFLLLPRPLLVAPQSSLCKWRNRLGDFPSLQNHTADIFIWVSPRADPKMKVWLQVVYLGENGGMSWEEERKSGVFMMLPAGTWASSCRGPSDIVKTDRQRWRGPGFLAAMRVLLCSTSGLP